VGSGPPAVGTFLQVFGADSGHAVR